MPARRPPEARAALETRWLTLVGQTLPSLAAARGWPIRDDHCFARVLLDNACGGCWYDHVARPAYRRADPALLERAVALGEDAIAGRRSLTDLNARSLAWRRQRASTNAARGSTKSLERADPGA